VGKTSSSAAYAAGLAEQGKRVLILSTDPAHSLGDALAEPLTGVPRELAENLWAAEVDPVEALRELREGLKAVDAKSYLEGLGLPGGTIAALGLDELSEVLESPPPGIDEIVAIAKAAADTEGFDVVVFDTAPTGHTLRMLEVPTFVGNFIDKALSVRKALGGMLGMFGLGALTGNVDKGLDEAEAKVRTVRARVAWLGEALKTPPGAGATSAEFVVVTRPTKLDSVEAERLVIELRREGIACRTMLVNQVIEPGSGEAYWNSRVDAQGEVLKEMRSVCQARKLPLLEVPSRPESLVGVPALGYLASMVFGPAGSDTVVPREKVVLFGGKGGVGKTSMSSALAVRAANEGKRVLIISTDPAHSLGDVLGTKLTKEAAPVPDFSGAGELWAMEVDTSAAMARFQETVRSALDASQSKGGMVGQFLQQLPMQDFVNLFDTLPPGSDEVVALTEVLEEFKKSKFDQIIIDTAPTGHALRLLSFPEFLERLADRIARLRERFGWIAGGDAGGPDQLRSFQFSMIELQDLFTDHEQTSFAVVSIPTVLAMEETKRLLKDLEDQDVKAGLVIMNRILDAGQAMDGLSSLLSTQQASLDELDAVSKRQGLEVTRIPYMDREVRGIYGLRYFSTNLPTEKA